jgi:hypothetical protein
MLSYSIHISNKIIVRISHFSYWCYMYDPYDSPWFIPLEHSGYYIYHPL